ncbi:MAG: TIGR03960 family B12-binding radical SAM protein [Candidatus Aminicenantes bacterium]|nr:TIGR03960 family B12-binding radical SAM protein [Candidatus Aminicenantes bacterium]
MLEKFPWLEEKALIDLLRHVQKPGRYLGREWNSYQKNPSEIKVKIALVFPDVYEIGMSYLGQKILYDQLNSQPDILAERVFAPWPDMERELRKRGWPLFSLENRLPLKEFDFIGISLLYELNYVNILTILDLGQISLKAEQRKDGDPLVIGGGPGALNPEPVAPFFDLFLLGDGEEAFLEVIRAYQELKKQGADRLSLLKHLASIEGVYVPHFYEVTSTSRSPLMIVKPKDQVPPIIRKRVIMPIDRAKFPVAIVVPNIQIIHDRVAMEIARGCPQKCRFCQATAIYFPFRARSPEKSIKTILESINKTGYEDVSLTALSVGDYPYFNEIIEALMTELEDKRISLSLSSLRPSGLTKEAIKNILKVRKTGFTLVPEAGTQRLRQVINKNLKNDEIIKAAELAFIHGWQLLKLYFMIGLPTETMDDIEGLIALTEDIYNIGRKIRHRPPRINLSLSPFIPKPHTPFQWLAMASPEELREKLNLIKSRLKRFPLIKVKDRKIEMSIIEAIISRGDRRLAAVLEKVWRQGARFESWGDNFNFALWQAAFNELQISMEDYLGAIDLEAELPWDHCWTGLRKDHLKQELQKAWQGKPTPSCFELNCANCLGCEAPAVFKPKKIEMPSTLSVVKKKGLKKAKSSQRLYRYIVFYEKKGLARFISHLDTIRVIERALRRAKIPVAYSHGFHPKIRLSFPPPIALGLEGYEECFELKLLEPIEVNEVVQKLNILLPLGLKFKDIKEVPASYPPLVRRLEAVHYFLDLSLPEVVESFYELKSEIKSREACLAWLEEKIREFSQFLSPKEKIWIDSSLGRLYIRLPLFSPSFQPRDFLEEYLGLRGISFYLVREKFIFKEQ